MHTQVCDKKKEKQNWDSRPAEQLDGVQKMARQKNAIRTGDNQVRKTRRSNVQFSMCKLPCATTLKMCEIRPSASVG